MGNSCGCCLSASPNNNSSNTPLVNQSPATPHPPLSLESVIHSIKVNIEKGDPTQHIDELIQFIDSIKAPSTCSWEIPRESVTWSTRAASDIIDTISREANELEKSEIAEELGRVALKAVKLVGEAHWIFLGLSMAAYALERCGTVTSNVSECSELLEKIVHLAKDVKTLGEKFPHETEKLSYAVNVIVEGTVLCSDYIGKGKLSRYWDADLKKAQLEKTGKTIADITSSLTLTTVANISRQLTLHVKHSPRNLLDFNPEGIKERVEEVKEMLDLEGSEPVVIVILWGLGGIGKSTLAKAVIRDLNLEPNFKYCRVVIDDQSPDKTGQIIGLQKDIIFHFGEQKKVFLDTEVGQEEIKQVVRNKRCFLYIDNVVDCDCISKLLPNQFLSNENTRSVQVTIEAKIRILITSRQNNIRRLPCINNNNCKLYNVSFLSDTAAKIILHERILRSGPDESKLSCDFDEEGCINAIAKACKGVPLLLYSFGNYLKVERDQNSYKEVLKALTEGDFDKFDNEDKLSEKLLFVYDKMRDVEAKEAFLDICTYFHGWKQISVAQIVDSEKLQYLQDKMLVRIESDRVIVHDILRLMARKVAKETRITNYSEFSAVVEDELKLKNMKGLSLTDNTCLTTIESTHLNVMRNSLRVLMLGDWVVIKGQCDREFTNLRCLEVGDVNAFPFTDSSKLVKLKYFKNKSKAGMYLRKLPPSLKAIIHKVPYLDCDEFAAPQIQNLKCLEGFQVQARQPITLSPGMRLPRSLLYSNLSCCSQLPERFDHLTSVEWLGLNKCDFQSLPKGFEQLANLKYLMMEHCPNLVHLSQGFGSLSSLTQLSVEGCTRLETLPADFRMLTALQHLWMGECQNLTTLPQDFGGLSSLEYLDLRGCINLQRLPESFSMLPLKSLTLQSLLSLEELPQSVGNMPSLTALTLESCNSLTGLPSSFVRLKMLQKLTIDKCIKLAALPNDFGRLSSLKHITVKNCPLLRKLPDGFQALPALEAVKLKRCRNLVGLPEGFGELSCLEELVLKSLTLSSLPEGFVNLRRLKHLQIRTCFKLETLPKDLENLPSLREVWLGFCPILDGATMERIVKLQHCYLVNITQSDGLKYRWKEMQRREEYPMLVQTNVTQDDDADWHNAARAALFSERVNYIKLSSTSHELTKGSFLGRHLAPTVAIILLPLHLESDHQNLLNGMCEVARKRSNAASSGQLQIIICLPCAEFDKQRQNDEEEIVKRALEWLPQGSYAIPVTDFRRRFLFQKLFFASLWKGGKRERSLSDGGELTCFMADVRVQDNGLFLLLDGETFGENISEKLIQTSDKSESHEEEDEIPDELQECIKFLCNTQAEEVEERAESASSLQVLAPKGSLFKMFTQALKEKGIDRFIDSNMREVDVDQLEGGNVCIIICNLNTLEFIKLQEIHQDLQCFNFKGIWIPLSNNEDYGFGTYLRAYGCMPWLSIYNPKLIQGIKGDSAHFILLDKDGKFISRDALSLAMSWGLKAYPFTQSKVNEIISKVHDKSSLEFLLEDIDFLNYEGHKVEKELISSKLIFLYAEPPSLDLKIKSKLDQLLQVHKEFKIIYIGHSSSIEQKDLEAYKKLYEDATKKMHYLKLSFWDMVMFWYRCKYLSDMMKDKHNLPITFERFVRQLYIEKRWLLFLDIDGMVTASGKEVVDIICKSNENRDDIDIMINDEVIKSLESGKCNKMVRTYFSDEISNHPHHHCEHPLSLTQRKRYIICDVCDLELKTIDFDNQRLYNCKTCTWDLCKDCWEAFAKEQAQCMLQL